ncbi:hypothetical protein Tco_0465046 [Tanacetum coccineum]
MDRSPWFGSISCTRLDPKDPPTVWELTVSSSISLPDGFFFNLTVEKDMSTHSPWLLVEKKYQKKRRSTYSTIAFRRSNEENNLSLRREVECSVIEAEDKEKGEREAILIVLVPPKGSVLDLVVKNLTETIFFALRNRSNYRCHTALCISGIFALDESRCTSVKPSKLPRIGRSNLECVRIFSPSIQHSKGHLVKAKTTYFASTEKRLASVRAKDQDVLSRAILPASINSFKP